MQRTQSHYFALALETGAALRRLGGVPRREALIKPPSDNPLGGIKIDVPGQEVSPKKTAS